MENDIKHQGSLPAIYVKLHDDEANGATTLQVNKDGKMVTVATFIDKEHALFFMDTIRKNFN